MPGLLESCKASFGTEDLYDVLQIKKEATENELKKAYYKMSLRVHPDRVKEEEKEKATQKFQTLGKVYCILTDKEKRAVYDETGEIDEENLVPGDKETDWGQYWRHLFTKINVEAIEKFEKEYKESDEELGDLKQAYVEGEGSMDHILGTVLCATIDDEPRFTKIISEWIRNEEVPDFDKFSKESKRKKETRKRKAAAEAREAEEMNKELGLNDTVDSLKSLILQKGKKRASDMDSFLDNLAMKYGGGGGGGGGGKKKGGKKMGRK